MSEPATTSTTEPTVPPAAPVTDPPTEPTVPPTEKGDKGAGDGDTIPKGRFDEVNNQRKDALSKLAAFEKKEADEADEKAKREGDATKFQTERDEAQSGLKTWDEYGAKRIETLTESLSDSQKALLATHDDSPLAKRLEVAEMLASETKETEPTSFGTNGGKPGAGPAGLIPSDVASPADYSVWMANLSSTNEGRALLCNETEMVKVREEAKRRKLRA